MRTRLTAILVVLLGIPVMAKMSERPKTLTLRDKSQEQVQVKTLPSIDVQKLLAEDRASGKNSPQRPMPQRFAIAATTFAQLAAPGRHARTGKAKVPNAELHVVNYTSTWTDGCCWEFTLDQHWGMPGNIMYVEAQLTPSTATFTNATGPANGAQAPVVMPNTVRWYMPAPDGLWGASQIVTVCVKGIPVVTGVTMTLIGYDSQGNTSPLQQTTVTFGDGGECDQMPDLWMKDTMTPDLPEDFGAEPSVSSLLYISRDIWVRTSQDTVGPSTNPGLDTTNAADRAYANEHQHQNPTYVNSTTPSYVYVKVRNRGTIGNSTSVLHVYWASASTGLSWPSSWNEIDCIPGGGIDPCALPVIAPQQDYVAELKWVPPNPQSFGGSTHFCLIARIETDPFGTFGMTVPEGPAIWQNVANNNNIVWKNITVFAGPQPSPGKVIIRNPLDRAAVLALRFAIPEREAKDSFLRYGDITVDVGQAIISKWRASGQRPSGFTVAGTTIKIIDPNAVLSGLRFNAGEAQTITVKMQLKPTMQFLADRTFNFDVTELATLQPDARPSPIGGERYTFTAAGKRESPTKNTN